MALHQLLHFLTKISVKLTYTLPLAYAILHFYTITSCVEGSPRPLPGSVIPWEDSEDSAYNRMRDYDLISERI